MKNVYVRSNNSVKNISFKIFLTLIPLIITGFYKNGIKLYLNDLVGILGIFKPLLFVLIGFAVGAFVNILYNSLFTKSKDNIKEIIFGSFHPIYGIIIASVISINTNLLLFLIITFIVLFISKLFKEAKFNSMAASALIIILIMRLLGDFSFLNIYESTKVLNLNTLDYLVGMGSGGINTSFVLFLFISLIFLMKEDFYKKGVAMFSIITFSSLMIGYCIFNNQIGLILEKIFANGILFCFIYIATDSLSSSYTLNGQKVFGVITGTLTFILFLIEPTLAALGAILIASLLHKVIDYICLKKA